MSPFAGRRDCGSRRSTCANAGEVVLYLHDPRRRNRQAAHGSRFKVKFVRPPMGK